MRYSWYCEGGGSESCLTYTSRYFCLHECPKSIAELGEENVLGLIRRTLFISGGVVTFFDMKLSAACRFSKWVYKPHWFTCSTLDLPVSHLRFGYLGKTEWVCSSAVAIWTPLKVTRYSASQRRGLDTCSACWTLTPWFAISTST